MKTAIIFPGQGSQFIGMGKELITSSKSSAIAKDVFLMAKDCLGFAIDQVMIEGSAEDLKLTKVTQPAIFIHSIIKAKSLETFNPHAVAGHSLGELSALCAAGYFTIEDGLNLVKQRAFAMQVACENTSGTMAAVLGMENHIVEKICQSITDKKSEIVVTANYNCIGQLVISGTNEGVKSAMELCKSEGAKRVLPLQVGGAFHSPLMESARNDFAKAVMSVKMSQGICPVYQNVTASPTKDNILIKENIIKQLTAPVQWTQSVQNMYNDGITNYVECGPGKVLQGLVRKIEKDATTSQVEV